jgi:hypothetical protein
MGRLPKLPAFYRQLFKLGLLVFKVAKSVSRFSAEMEYGAVVHAVCYGQRHENVGPGPVARPRRQLWARRP